MDLVKLEHARQEAGQLVAECVARGLPIEVACMSILLHAQAEGLPLPDDALAWATGGKLRDDDVLPKGRPDNEVIMQRMQRERKKFRRALGLR